MKNLSFISSKTLEYGLNETLTKAIQKASAGAQNEEEEERYTERVKQGGLGGGCARFFGSIFRRKDWGYDEVERTITVVKAGAVVDYLIEMHKICKKALNDSVKSFKIVFKRELYAKVFPVLRQIINDDSLIDEVAFKKSVRAVLDPIEFEEFSYTLPNKIGAKTGFLEGDEANQFIQSVGNYVRNFESEAKKDMKGYIQGLREALEKQNFASDTLKKLEENMQNLHNQVQNKEQSIAQLEKQIKALKGFNER